jgi:uncharacterized protein (TIGR02996 family)
VIFVDAHGRLAVATSPIYAAHSMDTAWYAVDRDGEVGYCWSGETGPVPDDAHRAYWEDLLPELFLARLASTSGDDPLSEAHGLHRVLSSATDPAEVGLVRAILDGDAASRLVYADWLEGHGRAREGTLREGTVFRFERDLRAIDPETLPDEWPGILVFTDAEQLEWCRQAFFEHDTGWRVLDRALGIAHAVSAYIPNYAFETAWAAGSLVTAYWLNSYEVKPNELGLYEYSCSFSGGAYDRNAMPKRPLLVTDLPEVLRSQLALLRIPDSFDKLPELDPDRYGSAHHWMT